MSVINAKIKAKNVGSGFLILSLILGIILIIAFLLPLAPSDYWTYLRIGEEIIHTGALPTTEFMTYTSGGQPAVYSYWLASLIFFGVYQLGGLPMTVFLGGLFIALFYALVWMCLRELEISPVASGLILLIIALLGSNNWSVRPQIFVFPLFALSLWVLIRWHARNNRGLWLLPLISILWANLHGSFILLFVLLGTALIFGRGSRRWLALILGFCLAATFVNPYGVDLWMNASGMVGNDIISKFSYEWQPPENRGWQMNLFFGSLLVMALVTAFSKIKTNLLWWIWFLGFGWMALSGMRYVIWFSVIEMLLLAQLAAPWLGQTLDRRPVFQNKVFNLVLGIVVLLIPLFTLPSIRQQWWQQAPENISDTTPVQAVEWLAQRPELEGEMWANWEASIYMTYALPGRKMWITNRIEDFTETQLIENTRLMRAADDWQAILDKYVVNLLLLDRVYDEELIKAVSSSSEWEQTYSNDQSIIFTR